MSSFPSQAQKDASNHPTLDASQPTSQPTAQEPAPPQPPKQTDRTPSPTPAPAQAPPATVPEPPPTPQQNPSDTIDASSSIPNPELSSTTLSYTPPQDNGQPATHSSSPLQANLGSSKEPLEKYDWDELEARYYAELEKCDEGEKAIQEDFRELIELFHRWTATGSKFEEERASKRLRTRIAFVQQSERSMEEKRLHYVKVVQAFESALALLGAD
ncbi:hypothetical protein MMC21_000534 [Puttea exsequens]|nr:hypothetical protein [Puttea exsequens]